MYQRVEIIGRVGKDPEMRYSQAGTAVTNFSVATSKSWKDKQTGQKQERTEWHNITAFNKLAEICAQYLKKGSLVFISGELQTDKWEKDGVTRYITKLIANEMKMLGGKAEEASSQKEDLDDDVPF